MASAVSCISIPMMPPLCMSTSTPGLCIRSAPCPHYGTEHRPCAVTTTQAGNGKEPPRDGNDMALSNEPYENPRCVPSYLFVSLFFYPHHRYSHNTIARTPMTPSMAMTTVTTNATVSTTTSTTATSTSSALPLPNTQPPRERQWFAPASEWLP